MNISTHYGIKTNSENGLKLARKLSNTSIWTTPHCAYVWWWLGFMHHKQQYDEIKQWKRK